LIQRFKSKENLIIIIFLISLSWPLLLIIQRGIEISNIDTRNLAKQWIEQNINSESALLLDENGPPLLLSEKAINEYVPKIKGTDSRGQFTAHYGTYLKYQELAAQSSISYYYKEIRLPWWRSSEAQAGVHELTSEYDKDMANSLKPVGVNSLDYYKKNGYHYVILQKNRYGAFLNPESKLSKKYPSFYAFYTQLFQNGILIKEFLPQKGITPGPVVKIFKIR